VSIAVLAYHAIGELRADPVLGRYTVTADEFTTHLDTLERLRYRFLDLDGLLAVVHGGSPPPPRGVVLSFDDGYADLLTTVAPELRRRGLPAVAFAVTGALGATNVWDTPRGATPLKLLGGSELSSLAGAGIEAGSHSHSHADLTQLSGTELQREVAGSRAELAAAGLPIPRAFSYPYGAVSAPVAAAVREAGYDLGFTLRFGSVRGAADLRRLAVMGRGLRG
jgi:peptidoglycan/xylan/chitin deacetylase (PgdA/CDA1 family)